ncbi:hypothetical protein [Marinoscillum pacificum]|uniref:hypothetical protein n=1 Tax=Marinoscillum pacificum TaxID=392723 RepID=UPI0021579732|nr:hypothetical protein [Marinoscillum pacificum]
MKRTLLALLTVLLISACEQTKSPPTKTESTAVANPFKVWTWLTAKSDWTDSTYQSKFQRLAESGIDAVLINTGTNPAELARLTPIASEEGLEVHAWIMAMNRPGDTVALQHPDWYAVSREGKSCFDTRPYVGYYQWMCPTRPESRGHVLNLVRGLAEVPGVASVHLDYIRYSDIFLPIGLLPKYDLVQNEELPEFDFCYCDKCIEKFESIHHKNPREMEHPELDLEWKQFRLNQVKAVVDDAYKIVHDNGKILTAAVFPYPEMAARMVRQRWDKWNIDMVLPMIYHNFYNEELDWIGFATGQGVSDLSARETELHTGLFIPSIPADQLKEAFEQAKTNGAKGVALFDAGALMEEHLAVIKEFTTQKND